MLLFFFMCVAAVVISASNGRKYTSERASEPASKLIQTPVQYVHDEGHYFSILLFFSFAFPLF